MSKSFGSIVKPSRTPPPRPSQCPDCGSHSILPMRYGLPGPEMVEKARRHEIVLGGCTVRNAMWYCNHCFNRWPEDPPRTGFHGTPAWQPKQLAEVAAEYASLAADAAMPPQDEEPSVENHWQRPDGRKVFLVRFPWGRMRIEKTFDLIARGGTPVYEGTGGRPPSGIDYARARRQAAVAAMRYEHHLQLPWYSPTRDDPK